VFYINKGHVTDLFKKKIVSNFFYLSLIQVANAVLPFVIIPHLVHSVGVDKIGIIYIAQAIMSYLTILTDYGFNLTATKFISVNRHSKNKLQFIYNAVISTKVLLAVIAFLVLLSLIFLVPALKQERLLFLLSFPVVIGNTFFPVWFFQGIEEMKYTSLMNFISKIIFTISIFFLINSKEDYVKVNFLLGAGNIISCLIAFYIIIKKYEIKNRFSLRYIKYQLTEGWHIFISNMAVNVYMYSNILILGVFADKTTLGYFGIADKCTQGIRQILMVFYQAIYPKACHVAKTSHLLLIEFYKRVFLKFLLLIALICLTIFAFAPFVAYLLTKSYHPELIIMLRIMCFIPLIVALNIPFSQSVIIYHIKKWYSIILVSGSVINVVCNIILTKKFSVFGTIGAIYITEIFVTVSLCLLLQYFNKSKYSLKRIFSL
jgi:PST family polysaccharide transporter